MNILVTGGRFHRSHIVDALVEQGHRVKFWTPSWTGTRRCWSAVPQPDAEFIQGDVCDADLVKRALEGIDVVYHKAAEVGVGQSMYEISRYVRANDLGTAVLLEEIVKRRPQAETRGGLVDVDLRRGRFVRQLRPHPTEPETIVTTPRSRLGAQLP